MNNKELTDYMNISIERLASNLIKAVFKNPKEALFLLQAKKILEEGKKKRNAKEEAGVHIPPFLISSITTNCNLFCKGCYARANGICTEKQDGDMLTKEQWQNLFDEAVGLGISFNLLAGGEPLLRKDVIMCAAKTKNMIFPIFTNGTLIDKEYVKLFDKNRNLIPVISLEGLGKTTDKRRGDGTYEKIIKVKEDKVKEILER